MLVILDSSVVAKWFFAEDLSTQAISVRQNWIGSKLDLLAPDLILTEVSNIIWKKQRLGLISNLEARDTLIDLLALALPTVSSQSLLIAAYNLAEKCDLTVYDSLYLALSIQMQAELITADLRLYNAVSSKLSLVKYLGNYY